MPNWPAAGGERNWYSPIVAFLSNCVDAHNGALDGSESAGAEDSCPRLYDGLKFIVRDRPTQDGVESAVRGPNIWRACRVEPAGPPHKTGATPGRGQGGLDSRHCGLSRRIRPLLVQRKSIVTLRSCSRVRTYRSRTPFLGVPSWRLGGIVPPLCPG